jgi:hypothetical protein
VANKSGQQDPDYELMETLDILIELREDLTELGISTIEELDERIREIEAQIQDDDGPV